jgi:hypothetical protein
LRGRSKPLSPAGLRALRDGDSESVEPLRRLRTETFMFEQQIDEAVNAAFKLTQQEVSLMWSTAPAANTGGPFCLSFLEPIRITRGTV